MRRLWTIVLLLAVAVPALAGERVPGEHWMRYVDPTEAGFDAAELEAARQTWEGLPSAAFMVVADGAVVAAWGDADRRFMCHSVRKSFLAALYGIYWDRGEIELNKTLADLGIDEEVDGLLPSEKQARILDLLKARSGVFHPAAYAGRTDSQPRGSQGPGRYFAYNNWDFNTLATILEQETGDSVFESFDQHFARPLGMEDWRLSDGYYHFEPDKSKYPAYPFRMSARDAARFGLLFAREGAWGDERILSRHWVRRCTALYSIDNEQFGYGFMWWIAREPRFADSGMAAALGVGNQMIAVLPDLDLVLVNRADTYRGQGTPMPGLLDLIEAVLAARSGTPVADPRLTPLEGSPADPRLAPVPDERLAEYVGEWPDPPAPLGLPERTSLTVTAENGHLVVYSPTAGTFKNYLQPDGWLLAEDRLERFLPIRDRDGRFAGLADTDTIVRAALGATGDDYRTARDRLALLDDETGLRVEAARAVLQLLGGHSRRGERAARALASRFEPQQVEAAVNGIGYLFMQGNRPDFAREVFTLNTSLFPEASNTWDSLGEAEAALGHTEEAIRHYERSLALNPDNQNAERMLERLRGGTE